MLARRLAGSMVTTTALRPRRAPSMASVAAVVVLPTPPVPQQRSTWRCSTSSASAVTGRAADAEHQLVGQQLDLGGSDVGGEEVREAQLREWEPFGEPRALLVLSAEEVGAKGRGGHQRIALGRVDRQPGDGGVGLHVTVEIQRWHALVHDDRAQRDAGAVLDRERGVDQLVDRCLLGQGHEQHLTTGRVGEQLDHLRGLLLDGPDLDRVEQSPGREEEGDRVPGGRRVEHDQVRRPRLFELLHLAEHEDVAHAGHRGRDHVEGARPSETLRDPSHTVGVEVLEQGVVGGEGPGPHPRSELRFLVGERSLAEARRQARFALDLDDQHAHARPGRRGGQRGGHRRLADPTLARHDHDPGGRAEALEVHGHRCYGSPHHATDVARNASRDAARSRRVRDRRRGLGARARRARGRGNPSGRQARHRRRADRGLPRPAERLAHPRRHRRGQRAADRRC